MATERPDRATQVTGVPVRADVEVVPLTPAGAAAAARIHAQRLPDGFFARLGRRFLTEYYRAWARSPLAAAYLAVTGGEVVGVVVGSRHAPAHTAWVLAHHRRRLATAGGLALVCRPLLVLQFLRTRAGRYARRLLRRPTATSAPGAVPCQAVLMHLAVAPGYDGRHLGRTLVGAFEDQLRVEGVTDVELVTAEAEGAAGFYGRLGYDTVARRQDRDGKTVLQMRKSLT